MQPVTSAETGSNSPDETCGFEVLRSRLELVEDQATYSAAKWFDEPVDVLQLQALDVRRR